MSVRGSEYLNGESKRRLDIVGGLAISGCFLPAALAIGLETMAEYKRLNPFFKQVREGKNSQLFDIYKFKSLRDAGDPAQFNGGANHPSASRIGSLIRKSGLDETPQIVNVIKGDLSLVGIRPVLPTYLEQYQSFVSESLFSEWKECYGQNLGLTGEGQLYTKQFPVHTPAIIRRQMEIEISATENASLGNDLRVIVSTPALLLRNLLVSPPEIALEQAVN